MRLSCCAYCAYFLGISCLCISPVAAQTWLEMGPAISRSGQVEGMSSQSNPVYGAVNVVAVHPTNATNANPTWSPATDFIDSLSIGALSFDRGNSNVVYAGIGRFSSLSGTGGDRDGLYVSSNGGVSFAPIAGNAALTNPGVNISSIAANGQNILVGVNTSNSGSMNDQGLWRSTNGGTTFTHVSGTASAPGLPTITASAVVADPTNSSRYYLAAPNASSTA